MHNLALLYPISKSKKHLLDLTNKNYNPTHIFTDYTVLIGDGTIINCAIINPDGIDVSSITISDLLTYRIV